MSSPFLGHTALVASSADGRLVGKVNIQAQEVRQRAGENLSIRLEPARQIEVTVRQDRKPASSVLIGYDRNQESLKTDERGRVTIYLPVSEQHVILSAWDKNRGVGGVTLNFESQSPLTRAVEIDLQPLKTVTFKAVDETGKPAAKVKVSPSFYIGSIEGNQPFYGATLPACHGVTDERGEWVCPWVAQNAEYPSIALIDKSTWIDDGSVDTRDRLKPTTLHLRRSQVAQGKVLMPPGKSPLGLLVEASSFGPFNMGTHFAARVAADGTFTLPVVSEHFYTIGILDSDWTSKPIHQVMCLQGEQPKELTVQVLEPQIVEVRVVAGKDATPVANVFLNGGYRSEQKWKDSSGKTRNLLTQIRQSALTNSDGYARFAVQPGEKMRFYANSGQWSEEAEATPPKSGPFIVTFRKPFVDKFKVIGRIVPPPAATGRVELRGAGMKNANFIAPKQSFPVEVKPDGSFVAETEFPKMRLLAMDRIGKTAAWASIEKEGDSITMNMVAVGAYGGTASDVDSNPLPFCEVTIFLNSAKGLLELKTKADAQGKFRFDDLPASAPLRIHLDPVGMAARFLEHGQTSLQPGESRLDGEVAFTEVASKKPAKPAPKRSVVTDKEYRLRDARIWHAPVLIIVQTPGTEAFLQEHLVSPEQPHPSYGFVFPLTVTTAQLDSDEADKKEFTSRGWSQPKPGEVMLIAISPEGKDLGTLTVQIKDKEAAGRMKDFLGKFEPAHSSAAKAIKQAVEEAKQTNRSLLLQLGGLRCGPCYLFARWIDKHRADIEKDFVVLKLTNLHDQWEDALREWSIKPSEGIPWTAILDANGKVVVTSDGPDGNFGFPSTREGVAHFRSMLVQGRHRFTDAELDALLADLLPKAATKGKP
ncbi:MAG TPA: hypothetical protein PLN21_04400 [Gemmatales bacterium]|nr:hypothetical protein [Gemmatales bacterium]